MSKNSENSKYLAARRATCDFLFNEQNKQVGIRLNFDGHHFEQWLPTELFDASNGPLCAAINGLCGVHAECPTQPPPAASAAKPSR